MDATILDLSPRGLGLLSPVALKPGDYFVVVSGKSRLLYCVVRCWATGQAFRIGAEFSLRLGKDMTISNIIQIRKMMAA